MIRVTLNGASGRMGRAITRIAEETGKIVVAHKVDVTEGFEKIEEITPNDVDVVIDISSPEGFKKALMWAVRNRKPFISGATGLQIADLISLDTAAESIPVLHTSNLSKGVNILFEIMKKAAALTGDADIEIIETHHSKKKDAPSGTALEIGKIITSGQSTRNLKSVEGRSGITGERGLNEIGYHSIRCGDVPGEHTVIFAYDGERIEISHKALTRDIFARGAIEAALFIAGKKPGRYSMKDVIGKG
ncbi:MAG TPA: 4-hydroxy-tetrahydrodipicolinate reductase [bacterium]|jgi:4-hydroxy-tetrahydrodipicolinate reductase|nr:4-hydroxy-tetrahydrodipicolinate reductase [bacterium]HQI04645.1 4-hydroxy-tetrahydrodipicolinate reductase [bacterium]